ncbi:MAG TPA: radical SAM family heme chaperone HemW [Acidimicrobiia bacterium]|nr:radical SAM family heme chaperone HemW [Acidimicrobiia bacterium]
MFGVYVHIPFCAARCDYCDFATWTDRSELIDDYVDACVVDLERRARDGLRDATSVFFGGGTPSLVPAEHLTRILDAIPRAAGAEVTVECNPDSIDAPKLAAYVRAGVTRVSLGVQSMVPHVLRALHRTHDPANVATAVAAARDAGIATMNVDVIYGTPGESDADWRHTLDAVLALDTPHLSAYALTVEPATPLGLRVAAGDARAPDDDVQADRYRVTDATLRAAGLDWYELSNWARPGHECRHNLLTWRQGDYLAIGCAAHGHTGGRRWWNVRTPERYIERIRAGRSPEQGSEVLDDASRAEEGFTLALRTRTGAAVAERAASEVATLLDAGLVVRAGHRVVLTTAGRMLANDITARLLAAGAAAPPGPHAAPAGTR